MAIASASPFSTSAGGSDAKRSDIGTWWQDLLTTNEIAKIRASQEAKFLAIEKADALNQKIFGLASDLFSTVRGKIGESAAGVVPPEYDEIIALFQPGGQFGEGAKGEIERGSQQALAEGQIGLASTGLSSGTNAAGLQARVSADAALAKAQVEDQRVQALAGALGEKGAATMTAEQIASQREAELLRTLTALKPNFVAA